MKPQVIFHVIIISAFSMLMISACKTKKLATKPQPVNNVPVTKPAEDKKQAPKTTTPVIIKPDFNFNRIQFDFNSAILKTGSIQFLDHAAMLIKKYPGHHFLLNGYASAEGTAKHNMALSEERANAVKSYLVNDGIGQASLSAKGYGEANAIASNKTETGRITNRRVEIIVDLIKIK